MEQGILKSFVAKMDTNGVQETYVSDRGTNYKFTVVLDNKGTITTGTAMSNKTTPSWKIGDEYSYEKNVSGASGQFTNIKSLKNLTNPFTPGGGVKAPNPEFGVQKAFEAAYECTYKFFELNQDIYNEKSETAIMDMMYGFIIEGSESRRWINMSAMRLTLLKLQANGDKFSKSAEMKLSDWLFSTAKAIANVMESTVKQQVEYDKKVKEAATANQAPQ